jgi:hypothetical protein
VVTSGAEPLPAQHLQVDALLVPDRSVVLPRPAGGHATADDEPPDQVRPHTVDGRLAPSDVVAVGP